MAGEGQVSKLPCDNGPLKGGKGQLYEGGTRVPALANWPGHLKPGSIVNEVIHVVDMFPTLARLAGASTAKCKPLDGADVWPAMAEGKTSGRAEVVYNIEPFRGAVRQGDWKLVWRSLLPSKVELFNLANDPNELTNLAGQQPEQVKLLQARIEQLAGEAAPPLIQAEAYRAIFGGLFGPAPLPTDDAASAEVP